MGKYENSNNKLFLLVQPLSGDPQSDAARDCSLPEEQCTFATIYIPQNFDPSINQTKYNVTKHVSRSIHSTLSFSGGVCHRLSVETIL